MNKNHETHASGDNAPVHDFAGAVNDLGATTGHAANEVKAAMRDAATHLADVAKQAANSVGENLDPEALKAALVKYTREHPFIVIGAAFAAGIIVSRALR
jgi:hypothetical protein